MSTYFLDLGFKHVMSFSMGAEVFGEIKEMMME